MKRDALIVNFAGLALCGLLGLVPLAGCVSSQSTAPPVAALDPATTQPSFWMDQPGQGVRHLDFDELWAACEDVARDLFFRIDRTDYRGGVLTTEPMVSKQWFEFWREDVRTSDQLSDSSLSDTRRTIRFQFTRDEASGAYTVEPIVLVERQAIAEQRITSVVNYRQAFRGPTNPRERQQGTRESDEGVVLPPRYWYLTGRDAALEREIADRVAKHVNR